MGWQHRGAEEGVWVFVQKDFVEIGTEGTFLRFTNHAVEREATAIEFCVEGLLFLGRTAAEVRQGECSAVVNIGVGDRGAICQAEGPA